MSPTPKRQPMITCPHCGAENDPARGSNRCRNCQLPLAGQLVPFEFPGTAQELRTITINGEPWFVAKDVCTVLAIGNHRQAISYLDDDEKGVISSDTPGGEQQISIVNEPGLYSLILRSRKPEAKAFKRWVTHEVLPAIRQTGSYSVTTTPRLPDLATPAGVLALAEKFHETARALVEADQRIQELEPKALAHDTYLTADKGDRLVREVAKLLGWKERDLRAFLLDERLIFRKQAVCGAYQYDVYADHVRHFRPVEKIVEHTWGSCAHYTLYVRPAGVDLIQRRIERRRASIQQSIEGGA